MQLLITTCDVYDSAVCVWSLISDHLWVLLPDVCMVIASEMTVDVVKHAFITKFNDIPADVSVTCGELNSQK